MHTEIMGGLVGVRGGVMATLALFLTACGPQTADSGSDLAVRTAMGGAGGETAPIYSDEEFLQARAGLGGDETRSGKSVFQRTSADAIFPNVDSTTPGGPVTDPVVPGGGGEVALGTPSQASNAQGGPGEDAPKPRSMTIQVRDLALALDAAAAGADDPVSAQFVRALLPLVGFTLGQDAIEVDDFDRRSDLTDSERQMLHSVAVFAKTVRGRLEAGENAREALAEELTTLLDAMHDPEAFAIAQAELATDIRGLGDFTPREGNTFQKGRNHDVRIYMDFEGVQWDFDGVNWSTQIQVQVQVLKSDGFRVYATDWETLQDNRSRRIGVFAWSSITLADDLEIGEYAVKIRVRQPDSNQLSERLIPIQIVSRLAQVGS
ncbi:MAG: hypothetical protein MK085_09030 [Phycisphaerales bacterium]|nr:hypothetical protein [Phycisphaerales bacterium]